MTSPGNDPAQPAAARIYDYLLGGKDNYAVDRAAAEQVLAVAPDQRQLARANRAFAIRAVRVLADAASGSSSTWEPGSRPRRACTRPPARPTRRPAWCTSTTTRWCTRTTRRCWPADRVASVRADIRPRHRILRFFDGFELLPPGLTDVQGWRQDSAAPTRLRIAGGVGRKP